MRFCWLVTLSIAQVVFSSSEDEPVVDSPSGKYRGHILKTRNDRDVLAFQGIPYALPPIGQLRFKDPVKMQKLEGIFEAKDDSIQCFQPSFSMQFTNISTYSGSEDCLYLNVYKPKMADGTDPLPVFFWIHGGGFMAGSGSTLWNGPEYLLDRDMILVTTNYRLGILGFLSSGDSVISGNFGMKDQVLAMKWVQENIAAFGGDPEQVTLGGLSAGAMSSSLHMHSPLSKGLFHRTISQSGTAHGIYSTKSTEQAKADSRKVATYLGCSTESEQLLKCLRKMPMSQLFEAATVPFTQDEVVMTIDFVPVTEERSQEPFLTPQSLMEPSKIPLLAGVTSHECMGWIRAFILSSPKYHGDMTLLIEDLEYLMAGFARYRGHPREKQITRDLFQFYFGGNLIKDANELKLIDAFSDFLMNHGLHTTAKLEKGPVYLYKFSYRGNTTLPGFTPPEGLEQAAGHGEDGMYVFEMKIMPSDATLPVSGKDLDMSNQMIDMWYNFITTGDPTPDTKLWKESNGGVNYLEYTNNGLHMESNMFHSRMEFLDKLKIDRRSIRHDEL